MCKAEMEILQYGLNKKKMLQRSICREPKLEDIIMTLESVAYLLTHWLTGAR